VTIFYCYFSSMGRFFFFFLH